MDAPGRGRRVATPLLLLAVTLLGGGLRLYAIGQKGLWLDEAFSIWLGWHRLSEMWGWIARIDQHPPLYYTLLNLWMRLGDDASTVRLLSVVAGTLTIPVIYLFGQRLSGPTVGLLAALLLAVSPFHVRFAQEARMYGLLALTAAAAMACLAYLLSSEVSGVTLSGSAGQLLRRRTASEESSCRAGRDSSLSWLCCGVLGTEPLGIMLGRGAFRAGVAWGGYVGFTAAAMLTHSAALLLPVATNLFVFGLMWLRGKAPPAPQPRGEVTVGDVGPPTAPQSRGEGSLSEVVPLTAPQSMGVGRLDAPLLRCWLLAQAGVFLLWGAIWLPALIGQAGGVYAGFWLPAPTWHTVMDVLGNFLSAHLPRQQMPWLDAIWVVYVGLLALGVAMLRRRPAVLALLLTLFLTPLVGELLISLLRPVFYDRTLIWATIPLYVVLAAGIAALRRWPYVLAAAAVLLAANVVSLREYYDNFHKEGWREAAAYVSQQAQEGDLILFNASWVQIPFDFYFRAKGDSVAEHGLPADLFERGVLEPKMAPDDLPRLHELIRGRGRVWLVYSHNWYTDPLGLIPAALSQALMPAESRPYEGLEIRLYEGAYEN